MENKHFDFFTIKSDNTKFKGTAVYYRIYNSLSKMNDDIGAITTYIYSEDNKAKAADKLLTTNEKNQGFKPLLYKGYNESILIDGDSDHSVTIRLQDHQYYEDDSSSEKAYMACIVFDKGTDKERTERPIRNVDNLSFNFGRSSIESNSRIPDKEDLDVCYSETASEDDEHRWYVPMFAVSVAMDESYTFNYSVPLYLGYVIIRDDRLDDDEI